MEGAESGIESVGAGGWRVETVESAVPGRSVTVHGRLDEGNTWCRSRALGLTRTRLGGGPEESDRPRVIVFAILTAP